MNNLIKTVGDLDSAVTTSYIFAALAGIVLILAAYIIANMIKWQGGKVDNSPKTRRGIFFSLPVVGVVVLLGLEYYLVMMRIMNPAFRSKYFLCMAIGAVVLLALYFIIGFILLKVVNRDSKFGSILPKKQ
ncbi:MAG: hypothetical protein LIO85_08795 [Rikenellaceae bacterium]|nr:hypothetical protein [Rikenellaceae bacterium]